MLIFWGEEEDTRSLKKEDNVLTVTLERALELLAIPKKSRRRKAATPLRELGPHPDDEKLVAIYDGPYGQYIKHSRTNVSLPEGQTVESVTLDMAVELLNAKAGTKGKKKTTKAKSTKSTTTAKKTTKAKSTKAKTGTKTTKTAAKKATAKKATAKKAESTPKSGTDDKQSSKQGDVIEVVAVKPKAGTKSANKTTKKTTNSSPSSAKAS